MWAAAYALLLSGKIELHIPHMVSTLGGVDTACVGAVEGEPPMSSPPDASWTFAAACSAVSRHRDEPLKGTVKAGVVVGLFEPCRVGLPLPFQRSSRSVPIAVAGAGSSG
jgi:hypothetical protein